MKQKLTDKEIKRAYAEYYRNKRLVEAGETFRGTKPRYERGKSPSSYKPLT